MVLLRLLVVVLLGALLAEGGCRTLRDGAVDDVADLQGDAATCGPMDARVAKLRGELTAGLAALAAIDQAKGRGPVSEGLALDGGAPAPAAAPACARDAAAIQVEIDLSQRLRELDALYARLTTHRIEVKFLVNDFYKVIVPDAPPTAAQLQPAFLADAKLVERFRAKILLSMIGMEYFPVGLAGAKCQYVGEPKFGAIETTHLMLDPEMRRVSTLVWDLVRRKPRRLERDVELPLDVRCGFGRLGDVSAGGVGGRVRRQLDDCADDGARDLRALFDLGAAAQRPDITETAFPEGLHPNLVDEVGELNAAMLGLYFKYVDGDWPADKGEPLAAFNEADKVTLRLEPPRACPRDERATCLFVRPEPDRPTPVGKEAEALQAITTEVEAAFNADAPQLQMKKLEDLLEHETWALGFRQEYARMTAPERALTQKALARRVALRRVLALLRQS
jgi:hypothetical protein